jgi:hypothetical protein
MTLNEELENKENEIDENQSLNGAYDRVSSTGQPPVMDGYFSEGGAYLTGAETGKAAPDSEFSVSDSDTGSVADTETDTSGAAEKPEVESEDAKLTFKSVLDGSLFTRKMFEKIFPYICFVGLLFVLYIANRNVAESLIRRNIVLKREVRELRAESIIIAAELMEISKETEVATRIEKKQLGIYVQKIPPSVFYVDKFQRVDSLKEGFSPKKKKKSQEKDLTED